jgi:hypothetical protein
MAKPRRSKELGPLQAAVEVAREDRALATIASDAKVSTKTLAFVRKGKVVSNRASSRERSGWAESLTRLALHLRVEPASALAEFGLSTAEADVRTAAERALRSVSRPQMVDDRALRDIELRRLSTEATRDIRLGILKWPPFYYGSQKSGFAEPFTRRLVQSVNPFWRAGEIEEFETIEDAINGLINEPPTCELCFGLYDTSYRRELGLDFVPVPGLFIDLGAVAARPLTWPDLIDTTRGTPHALVLKEEAGFHLLRGACDYKDTVDLTVVDHHDPPRLAAHLIALWRKFRTRDVALVVDANTCRAVLSEITDGDSWRKHWREHAGHGAEAPTSSDLGSFCMVTSSAGGSAGGGWTPRYPVCIAVRADSPRLRELLNAALRADLFEHGRLATARLYQQLLETAGPADVSLHRSTLDELGEGHFDRFNQAWKYVRAVRPDGRQSSTTDVPWSKLDD